MARTGRPTKYSPELGVTIADYIMSGLSLVKIAKLDIMPHKATLCRWLIDADKTEFHDLYARAKAVSTELQVDSIVDLANTAEPKTAHVVRLQVDTLKWAAEKLIPKKYGDVRRIQHTGTVQHAVLVAHLDDKVSTMLGTQKVVE